MTRRRLGVGAVVVALVVVLAALRTTVTPTRIYGYRVVDDYTVALQVLGAHPTWRALTTQTETETDVTIAVSEISLHLGPGFGDERIGYVIVTLEAPLELRRLINASTGDDIPRLAPDT